MRCTAPELCACVPYYLRREVGDEGPCLPDPIHPDVITDYLPLFDHRARREAIGRAHIVALGTTRLFG